MNITYKELDNEKCQQFNIDNPQLTSDEILKRLSDFLCQHTQVSHLVLENIPIYRDGMMALQNAIIGHPNLRSLHLDKNEMNSYPACSDHEGYFPSELDEAVALLAEMFKEAHIEHLIVNDLRFKDRTQRKIIHYDMVDPSAMREILQEEKIPVYISIIFEALKHNPHLQRIDFTLDQTNVEKQVDEIKDCIKKREQAKKINFLLQSTYGASETELSNWYVFFSKNRDECNPPHVKNNIKPFDRSKN